jgi:hypothetical protein
MRILNGGDTFGMQKISLVGDGEDAALFCIVPDMPECNFQTLPQ